MAVTLRGPSCNRLDSGAHGCGDSNCVRVISRTTLNPVTRREKRVEALDKVWVSSEEFRNPVYDTRRINAKKGKPIRSLSPKRILKECIAYDWLLKSFIISKKRLYTSGWS